MQRTEKYLTAIIIIVFAIALASVTSTPRQSVVVPHIVVGTDQSAPINATSTFLFEKSRITITVPVDAAVYHAAKSTDKSVSIYGNVSEGYMGFGQLPCHGK